MKLKEEISMAKELGGKMKQGKEVKNEQEKKKVVANKEVEVGPEEFLKQLFVCIVSVICLYCHQ